MLEATLKDRVLSNILRSDIEAMLIAFKGEIREAAVSYDDV